MQAKDIPDHVILGLVLAENERVPIVLPVFNITLKGPRSATWQYLCEMLPDVPPKVILAKCRSLIRRGWLEGCGCGCRGDFVIVEGAP